MNRLNILPENGKNHNTRATNGTRTRHTTRKLRSTYRDLNYKDMDIKIEDEGSPQRKQGSSVVERLRVPSRPRMHSQGIITRNRLQCMASPNTRAKLIGTAMKIEDAVKEEDTVKKEPVVNMRRSDCSWLKSPKLVHLDRTPCSDECIASNHYGKARDFPDTSAAASADTARGEQVVTPNKDNKRMVYGEQTVTPNKNSTCTAKKTNTSNSINANINVTATTSTTTNKNVTSTNTAEVLMDVGDDLPDLGSKMTDPKPPDTAPIDLPVSTADDITLPEMEIVDDFLEDADNADALLSVDAAPVPDFAKGMAIEEGIDRDLEVKLENLAFLDKRKNEPTKTDKQQTKCDTRKNTQSVQQCNKPRYAKQDSNQNNRQESWKNLYGS